MTFRAVGPPSVDGCGVVARTWIFISHISYLLAIYQIITPTVKTPLDAEILSKFGTTAILLIIS
jgi:hypothetical protein